MLKPTSLDQLQSDLRQAHATVRENRAVLNKAAADADRADALERTARDELATLEAERAQLVSAAGDQLAAAIVKGMPDDVALTHAAVDEKIRAAAIRLSIRMNAAAQLRAIHVAAVNKTHVAETARSKVAEALTCLEVEQLAEEFHTRFDAACALGERLRQFAGNGLDLPIPVSQRIFSDRVRGALHRLPEPDHLNTPVNVLRGNVSRGDLWAQRRAELIAELEKES